MSGGATGTSKCCAFLRTWHSPETPGYIYDAAASGAIIVTNFFLIFAVTELATEDAGCDPDSDDVCTEHVHGLRPSNIMPYIATISGLISAVFMPIAGTVIDHTPFQWESGIISALVLTVVTLVQGLIAVPDLWFLIALLQVLSIVSYTVHIVVVTAYQPDFTDGLETEEERQAEFNKINAAGVFATFGTETFLIPFFLAVGAIGGLSTAGVSSFAQIFSGILVAVLFYFAWDARMGTLKKRPQKQQNAEGVNILTCGFKKLTATWKEINETNKGLAGFLIAEAFAEAAFSAFSSIAIIFMAGQLNATITESFAVILIVLVVPLKAKPHHSPRHLPHRHLTEPRTPSLTSNHDLHGCVLHALRLDRPRPRPTIPGVHLRHFVRLRLRDLLQRIPLLVHDGMVQRKELTQSELRRGPTLSDPPEPSAISAFPT
mmetsp:Transcript_34823/g.109337  ORF Transcript_34823/g.109337 Transcript_34823/m.109337 type:complete len:432 (-) Transcript_34823:1322-2617(-)